MRRLLLLSISFYFLSFSFHTSTLLAQNSCSGDTLLYEDFSNGFSGNNSLGIAWDTSGTHQAWRDCPSNCTSNGNLYDVGPLASNSATNGYVNLDLQDVVGYTTTSGGPVPSFQMTVNNPLDLSSLSAPLLQFETTFLHCCEPGHNPMVQVSTDGGNTWTDIPVLPHIKRNEAPSNPRIVNIPLSDAIAGNPSNVTIRFTWPPSMSAGQVSGVANWYIDDVVVQDAHRNDIKMYPNTAYVESNSSYFNNPNVPSSGVGTSSFAVEYTMIPKCNFNCLQFGGQLCNVGENSLNDVRVLATVNNANTGVQVYQDTSNSFSLDSLSCVGSSLGAVPDTLYTQTCMDSTNTIEDTGTYNVEYEAFLGDTADCDTSNNTLGKTEQFRITDRTYAIDEYAQLGQTERPIVSPTNAGNAEPFTVYNTFEFSWFLQGRDRVKEVCFYLDDTTEVGAGPISVGFASMVEHMNSSTFYGSSNAYFVQSGDPGSWVCLDLTIDSNMNSIDGVSVPTGSNSLQTVYFNAAGNSGKIGLATSGENQPGHAFQWGDFYGTGVNLFTPNNIPMLRVKMDYQQDISITACGSYTVPSGDTTFTTPGSYTYTDTVVGYFSCDSVFTVDLTLGGSVDPQLSVSNDTLYSGATGVTYQWIECDTSGNTIVSGANSSTYAPDSSGMYAVAVNNGNCTSTSLCVSTLPNSEWNAFTVQDTTALRSVHFVDSATGWAVGMGGRIHSTSNGGNDWNLQFDTSVALNSVHFEDVDTGWVVGADGTILHSQDGGSSWTPQTSGVSDTLTSCQFVNGSQGWTVGNNGTILETSDGGMNWNIQSSGLSNDLASVHFQDNMLGWVSGSNGSVLNTTDGGSSWNNQNPTVPHDLNSIQFVSDTAGWTVGDNGTILLTEDGGNSWTSQTSGTPEDLLSISMINNQEGWIVGEFGTLLHTTNGRANWTQVLEEGIVHSMYDVHMLDGKKGFIASDNGVLFRKGDGITSIRKYEGKEAGKFTLHPNPAEERVRVRYLGDGSGIFRYTLYDVMGRSVKQGNGELGRETMIQLEEVGSGIHFLKIEADGAAGRNAPVVRKLVVK